MTLTFDQLVPEVDGYVARRTTFANLPQNRFVYLQNIVFIRLIMDEQTDGRTDGQVENIMHPGLHCILSGVLPCLLTAVIGDDQLRLSGNYY